MPRIPRAQIPGYAYHVINRGNARATVFHKDDDYLAFINLLAEAKSKSPVKTLAFCLMPNHFHLVLQPETTLTLSTFMQWFLTCHVRRYHRIYRTSGHVWQGRYKSFPIQQDEHLLTVIRYVLRNPVRAKLAHRTDQWPWSSIQYPEIIDSWPLPQPLNWNQWIEQPLSALELLRIRTCVNRQAPFGTSDWQEKLVKQTGLESTLRPRGRPRKTLEK